MRKVQFLEINRSFPVVVMTYFVEGNFSKMSFILGKLKNKS